MSSVIHILDLSVFSLTIGRIRPHNALCEPIFGCVKASPTPVTGPAQVTGPEQVKGPEPVQGQHRWLHIFKLKRLLSLVLLSWAAAGCSGTVDLPILGKVLMPKIPGCSRDIPALDHAKPKAKSAANQSKKSANQKASIKKVELVPTKAPTPLGETIFFQTKEKGYWTIMGIDPQGESLRRISPRFSNAWGMVVSKDGLRIAYVSDQSGSAEIWINTPLGNSQRQLTFSGELNIEPDPNAVPRASFSPDGESLAWIQRGEIWLGSLDGLNPETLVSHRPSGQIESVWFSPSGNEVAYHVRGGAQELGVWVVPLAGRKPAKRIENRLLNGWLIWRTKGRKFTYWDAGPVVHSLDIGDQRLGSESYLPNKVTGTTNGETLAYVGGTENTGEGAMLIYHPAGKDPITLTEEGASQPSFSPDGKTLVFRLQGDLWLINVQDHARSRLTYIGARSPLWASAPPKASSKKKMSK